MSFRDLGEAIAFGESDEEAIDKIEAALAVLGRRSVFSVSIV